MDVMSDPRLYAHVRKQHDDTLLSIFEVAQRRTKRKRKREVLLDSEENELPALTELKGELESIKLDSWPYVAPQYMHAQSH